MNPTVHVEGAGMTRFGRFLDRNLKSLAHEAIAQALGDAERPLADVQAVFFANSLAGLITGQEAVRGQTVMRAEGLEYVPVVNVENACASGATAVHLACTALRAGVYERVLVVGVERLSHPEKGRSFVALAAATDVEELPEGPAGRSMFMDIYATAARHHMQSHGVAACDYAWIAAKNHTHAVANERAQYRQAMTADEVLAAPSVVDPLTVPMCSPIGDGAAALVLARSDAVSANGRIPVSIGGTALGSGGAASKGDPSAALRLVAARAYEGLGFCAAGDGVRLVREEATRLGGTLPVNVSGGLVSKGHPVGATGVAQLVELTAQLRGEAGSRQVEHARVAIAHNGGGYVAGDVAAIGVTVLVGGRP